MGGLAIRAWTEKYDSKTQAIERVHHIYTLGTPHRGTEIGQMSHTKNGHEMRRGSNWLSHNMAALPDDFVKNCTCFYSNCDNIVFPSTSATLEGADNRLVVQRGHVELAFDRQVMQVCLQV